MKKVAIIGVTGAVGQEFVVSLENHPWFEVTQIAASDRSAGKKYLDAIKDPVSGITNWQVGGSIPDYIKEFTVRSVDEITGTIYHVGLLADGPILRNLRRDPRSRPPSRDSPPYGRQQEHRGP